MESKKEKAWLVTYPGMEYDEESEIAFGETRNKVKYGFVGDGDDARWVDIRVVRAKDLDDKKDKWNNDSRFRNLWFINNGFLIDSWLMKNGKERVLSYISGDEIREVLQYPYEQKLTYNDIDMYVNF